MCDYTSKRFSCQAENLRTQFPRSAELPFSNILSAERTEAIVAELGIQFREKIYTPLTTLLAFLCQVLSADHSRVPQWRVWRRMDSAAGKTVFPENRRILVRPGIAGRRRAHHRSNRQRGRPSA